MRVKSVTYTRQRKKKHLRMAKGYYSQKKNHWRMAIEQIEKSLVYAYAGRKDKKGNFRRLWISRLNAAAREAGLSYSKFIQGLHKANININRKVLSELAVNDSAAFKKLAEIAKNSLAS